MGKRVKIRHINFFIFFIFLLSFPVDLLAQNAKKSAETNTITAFLKWIEKLDKAITSINDVENLKQIDRLLGDIGLDFDNLNNEIKTFSQFIIKYLRHPISISRNNEDVNNQLHQICHDIGNLSSSYGHLKLLLVQSDQDEIDSLLNNTGLSLANCMETWEEVNRYFFSHGESDQYIDENKHNKIRDIKNDVDLSIQRTTELRQKIGYARNTIQNKITKQN